MKKTMLIPVLAGIIGFIVVSQHDSNMGSAAKTGQAPEACFPTERAQENRTDESHGDTNPSGEIRPVEHSTFPGRETDEFRKLIVEIMRKNDLSPEERNSLRDMLSLVEPPSK